MKSKVLARTFYCLSVVPVIWFILSGQKPGLQQQEKFPPAGIAFQIDTLATNLRVPWQIAFLPDQSMIFTERPGRVRIYRNGKLSDRIVFNVADIATRVKTGLLGLAVHPDFAVNHFIYLANNYTENDRMRLRITRYEFGQDTLIHPLVILKDLPANQNHTGCRLMFGPDKKLYITTGDADQPVLAQDLKTYNGKILRINDDGSIPQDNPFVQRDSAKKEIWTYGHRNTQGLVFQPVSGVLFNTEHGPTGGDEVNIIVKGANYGWPVIHHQLTQEGMVSPLLEFTPSIGPSEAMFYQAAAFPELRGNLLVACLRGEEILRIRFDQQKVIGQDVLFKNQFGRIRSLVTGPDGYIYLSTSHYDLPEGVGNPPFDLILRLRPTADPLKKVKISAVKGASLAATGKNKSNTAGLFQQLCASCHGSNGGTQIKAINFAKEKLRYGTDRRSVIGNITRGIPEKGMPAWAGAISTAEIGKLADYILKSQKK